MLTRVVCNVGPPTNCTECGRRFKNPGVSDHGKAKQGRTRICPPCAKKLKAEKKRKKQEGNDA